MKLEEMFLIEKSREDRDISKAPSPSGEYVSSATAAKTLGVNMSRIRQLIADGTLGAKSPEKGRRDNLVKMADVQRYKNSDREPGRPEKGKEKDKDS